MICDTIFKENIVGLSLPLSRRDRMRCEITFLSFSNLTKNGITKCCKKHLINMSDYILLAHVNGLIKNYHNGKGKKIKTDGVFHWSKKSEERSYSSNQIESIS